MHPLLTRRFALSAAAALLAPEVMAASPDRWTIVTEYPASAISGEGVAFFAATATGFSGGALDVQSQFDAPGGLRSAAMLEAVANGTVTAADAFTGALSGAAAIFQLWALPFLTRSATDTARLLSIARPSYEAALAARNLALLYATPWPPTGLWSRAPVSDVTALPGLRVRTYDSASTAVLAAVGAKPAQISFADALPRLRAGALDAVLSSGDGGAGARLWEILPHFTILDYAFPLSLAFCAERSLAALPWPVAEGVRHAARDTEARQFQAMSTRVNDNEARMRQNGVKIADTPSLRAALQRAALQRAALQRAAEPVIAAWAQTAGSDGRAILDAYSAGQT